VWVNNNITPMERPAQWAGKQTLTREELAELQQLAADVVEGGNDGAFGDTLVLLALAKEKNAPSREECADQPRRGSEPLPAAKDCKTPGAYNHFWLAGRDFDNPRTSIVVEPADGKIPPLTPEARQRVVAVAEARRLHAADGPEDRPLGERCVSFGLPKLGAGYNSNYQIFQTPGYVVILSEMAHDARIIPLDGRPHLDKSLRQWNGDARGRWDGNTLVVETTNFSPKSDFRGSRDNLSLVERFTRVGPKTLNYEVTISDPTTWTKTWKAFIPLKGSQDQIYEYACHEGNYGLEGILRAARSDEKAAALGAK
jgi:hypothetical protein